jgi:FMN reductase (NADPH)/FMN reductase [NAD(P)H]
MTPTNETIALMDGRCSTRSYSPEPITEDEKQTILHTAMRAPTAGNMMLYSIIEIEDQALKDRLAETCDHQPFIARAPWVLLFAADVQKWMDLFAVSGIEGLEGVPHDITPGPGWLMLACCDALIAAQSAVLAAESLGIGSCYIGDILELGETHADLLQLPRYTFPVTMLCFGRPKARSRRVERYEKHMVHRNTYRRLGTDELREVSDDLDRLYGAHGFGGFANYVQEVYARKVAADFALEADRSVAWWIERWAERSRF